MKILVTGSNGFIGKNLVEALKNIRDKKDSSRKSLIVEEIYCFDKETDIHLLEEYCCNCDFVFHLAGINRPKNIEEFKEGNVEFTNTLLKLLKNNKNNCPVMISSSIQAEIDNEYGKSKKMAEELIFKHSEEIKAKVLVYRFTNLFGKWCKPNYNSVIATWCHNIANNLDIQIDDKNKEINLCYIDDVIKELLDSLENKEHRNGEYCYVPITYKIKLGHIIEMLNQFKNQSKTLIIPEIKYNSFEKKLYSTYLTYLSKENIKFELKMNNDNRGSFTELIKSNSCGQISVNMSKPGIKKGEHWHNSKWELFIVVKGHALIQERKIGTNEVIEFYVSGDKIEAVHMIPGYTHNIINLSDTEELITIMWANELFNKEFPDTFSEEVKSDF